ncbi:MAG: hypothetical protein MZV64_59800 [Ignavibacteriales bacterium]|nr:hypothetical protein [Ignavibacteriales bacterium]
MDGRHVPRQVEVQGDVLLAHLTARVGHGIVDDEVQVHGFRLEVVQTRFEGGDLDQVVDQVRDPFGGRLDALHEFALQCAEDADRFSQQQVGVTHNGGHRLAQFLGYGRDHLRLLGGVRSG